MSRNTLFLVIGVLAVAIGVISFQLYREKQKTSGVEIKFNEKGISIEQK